MITADLIELCACGLMLLYAVSEPTAVMRIWQIATCIVIGTGIIILTTASPVQSGADNYIFKTGSALKVIGELMALYMVFTYMSWWIKRGQDENDQH